MIWKKNIFSYLVWLIYTMFTAGILLIAAEWLGERLPGGILGGIPYGRWILSAGIVVLAGWTVFLMRWFVKRRKPADRKTVIFNLIVEAVAAVLLLAYGLILRLEGMSGQGELAAYYETASAVQGRSIPLVVHGAGYLYLQLLHILFLFLGNKFAVAVWLQIILSLIAALILFVAVRKLAGSVAALAMLGFLMCSGHMVQDAVTLSPQMLYLLIFAIGLDAMSLCRGRKPLPGGFLVAGLWIGVTVYLDAAGLLLLIFLAMCAAGERLERTKVRDKLIAFGFGMLGALVSFWGAMGIDAAFSGKRFERVVGAWADLYSPWGFQLPVFEWAESIGWWSIVLGVLLTVGVFSFWCDRKSERMCVWVLGACAAGGAWCMGMYTEELPVSLYLFLFLVVLAGLGVGEVFRKPVSAGVSSTEFAEMSAEPVKTPTGSDMTLLESAEISTETAETSMGSAEVQVESAKVQVETAETSTESAEAPMGSAEASVESAVEVTAQKPDSSETAAKGMEIGEAAAVEAGRKESGLEEIKEGEVAPKEPKVIKYIENPLPLPKPHVKKTMDYDRVTNADGDDFDYFVSDDDDFDI